MSSQPADRASFAPPADASAGTIARPIGFVRPRRLALCLSSLVLAAALAPVGHAASGTLSGASPLAPCCDFAWTPPDEAGTGLSEIVGAPYHSYSFFVSESGVYTVTSGPGDVQDSGWPGLVALYAPGSDASRPLEGLIGVDYYDAGAQPAAELSAYLVAGAVYRVVTSNLDDETHFYVTQVVGPGEVLTNACYPVGDEVDSTDGDIEGFAIQRDRFCVQADWATDQGTSGFARMVPFRSDDSVLFWFFAPDNWELQVKVLDACAVNGHFWVFFAATTNVELELRVFGRGPNFINPLLTKTYVNPQGHRADAVTDTAAFPCDEVIDALP
ncbi:MAG TPA: hypothetical protein VM617_07860 [Thermoanaerobaculia bacterium]|nr:hypothetical protein [Thermoanaerobaculia bacterium]